MRLKTWITKNANKYSTNFSDNPGQNWCPILPNRHFQSPCLILVKALYLGVSTLNVSTILKANKSSLSFSFLFDFLLALFKVSIMAESRALGCCSLGCWRLLASRLRLCLGGFGVEKLSSITDESSPAIDTESASYLVWGAILLLLGLLTRVSLRNESSST